MSSRTERIEEYEQKFSDMGFSGDSLSHAIKECDDAYHAGFLAGRVRHDFTAEEAFSIYAADRDIDGQYMSCQRWVEDEFVKAFDLAVKRPNVPANDEFLEGKRSSAVINEANMSYCRFENTHNALQDCIYALKDMCDSEECDLAGSELSSLLAMYTQAKTLVELVDELKERKILREEE